MTICETISNCLKSLNIPVAEGIYKGSEKEYCRFNIFSEHPVLFADDESVEDAAEGYLHYFTKDYSHRKKSKIKKLLKSSDINIIDIETLHEEDTGYTHIIFQIQITNIDDEESEE